YLQADGLGSITSLITETGGFSSTLVLAERYTYDAFGNLRITNYGSDQQMDTADDIILSASTFGNSHFFTGREFDSESGLYHYRLRYYDPRLGRFIQEDPIGLLGGIHFYAYVRNSPMNAIDPFGLGPVKDGVKAALEENLGGHLSGEDREKAATVFEEEARHLGKEDDFIKNSALALAHLRSEKKKKEIEDKLSQEVYDNLHEKAKQDAGLADLEKKLEDAKKAHEQDKEHCGLVKEKK
ncbi:MAG: RHS repeat-associated core domain-containing protein, partial [Nitrososphaera sp.]|nr:RHS repeat-associated core domain-containing protein [Nitrososphaera sp.]